MKRIKITVSVILFLLMPLLILVFANTGNEPIMKNGVITWETEGKRATTNVYYRTVGWTVHKEKIPNGDISQSGKPYGKFMMQQIEEIPSKIIGNVITKFKCSWENNVKVGLIQADKNIDWKNGEKVYLSAIMEVRQGDGFGGYKVLGTYTDLSKLKSSQNWINPNDFDQYFNKELVLSLPPEDIHKKVKINGEIISDEIVYSGLPGEQKLIKFDEKITYKGKEYALNRSCVELRGRQGITFGDFSIPEYKIDIISNRYVPIFVGGTNVYGHYVSDDLQATIQHFDKNTMQRLKEDEIRSVKFNEEVSASAETFEKKYIYSVFSEDGGVTWHSKSEEVTRTLIVKKDTIIRFYYSGVSDLIADLDLSAAPNAIREGATATVNFTLNASGSTGKYPIVKYEYWFGANKDKDLKGSADYTSDKALQQVTKNGVEPGTTWYGMVRVTDSKGNTATATDEVTIDTIKDANVKVFAGINSIDILNCTDTEDMSGFEGAKQLVDYIESIDVKPGSGTNNVDSYTVYLKRDQEVLKALKENIESISFSYELGIDASKSWSTNGIGKYHFKLDGSGGTIRKFETNGSYGTANSSTLGKRQYLSYELYYMYFNDTVIEMPVSVVAYDSVATNKSATSDTVKIYFKASQGADNEIPGVHLEINRNVFGVGETAIFTPSFTRNELITDKKWTIENSDKEVVINGSGEIGQIVLDLAEGHYSAKQYIYYSDIDNETIQDFASVEFDITTMREPDVNITCDKEKYKTNETGCFNVVCSDKEPYTYVIEKRKWKLVNTSTNEMYSGEGDFPSSVFFDENNYSAGYYEAFQTIFWTENGTEKDKTASCKFKLTSDKPVSDFDILMKTYQGFKDVEYLGRLEEGAFSITPDYSKDGMQYKQIRIDLSKSEELNKELENENDMIWDSQETQIMIVPICFINRIDEEKVRNSYMENGVEKESSSFLIFSKYKHEIQSFEVTKEGPKHYAQARVYKGNKYVDIRFDSAGYYWIRVKTVNEKGVSNWREKKILILPDFSPKVEFEIEGGKENDGLYRFTRQEDLHIRGKVHLKAKSTDIDDVDFDGVILTFGYDKNADGKRDERDGKYNEMIFSKEKNTMPPGFNVVKDSDTSYSFDFFDGEDPVLGKISIEVSVGQIPFYPDYVE